MNVIKKPIKYNINYKFHHHLKIYNEIARLKHV